MRRPPSVAWLPIAVLLAPGAPLGPREVREQAYRANNRGVALLEQFRAEAAVDGFRTALSLDPQLAIARINLAIALLNVPDLPAAEREARAAVAATPEAPQAHYVLGLAARGQGHTEDAKAAFRRVLALDPADVGSSVNLGQLLVQEQSYAEAIEAFRAALAAEPYNATAAYNLGLTLTRFGRTEEGQKMLERFRSLREGGYGTLIGQSYPEQGRYAEAIASTGAETDLVDSTAPAVRFVDATQEALPVSPAAREAGAGREAGRVTLFDFDGDGALDGLHVRASGQRLYRNDAGRFVDATARQGLDPQRGGVGSVAGDLDNDTRPDLVVLGGADVRLYRNDAKAGFVDITTTAAIAPAGATLAAALADLDHDGDLDVLLGGSGAPDQLWQNTGDATFKNVSAAAGLTGAVRVLAALPTDFDNGRDLDLLEVLASGPPRLFRNLRDGTFRDVAGEVGLARPTTLLSVAAADVSKDGYTDFFFGAEGGDWLALSNGKGGFGATPVPWGSAGTTSAQFLDYDNDGLLDLVTFSGGGARLLRNLGSRWEDLSDTALPAERRIAVSGFAAGDLDGDGDTDLLLSLESGELRLWRNDGGSRNRSLGVRLAALVSNRSSVGAKIELRAGSLLQKLETYAATPAPAPADVLFGLGPRETADAVRVIWPAGIVQTEVGPPSSAETRTTAILPIKELDRKPSSCPYLYAWNGRSFEFVSDFMGGGEMGYFMAPGVWNQPDPVEYVRLRDEQLRPREGRYELRVTNELEEALFLDHLALVAVAHPGDVEVHPYEGMTAPPKPFGLYAVRNARVPLSAADDRGREVRDRISLVDRRYPDGFGLHKIRGYADEHALTLDLGAVGERSVLLLSGWTDYAFSSDNVAAHQAGLALRPPSLQVEDASGRWVTVIAQLGIPVGRPQTVLADLAGIWKGPSRRVRIVTNMRIYWDQVRVADVVDARLEATTLTASRAQLRERGFSAETTPDGREPFGYDYERVSRSSPWKAIPGRYTRPGDVAELLLVADDVFVTSRPGDEIALTFDARELPGLPEGWRRTFLLLSDGFSKEMDIRSATPDALGPLPFHGMSRYPYAAPEAFPMTEARSRLIERYNTRLVRAPLLGLDAALHGRTEATRGAATR